MTTDRDPTKTVITWLHEEPTVPADTVAVRLRVLERLPEVQRRGKRWPIPGWLIPHQPSGRRLTTMFTTLRVASLTAILALGGTLLLATSVRGPLPPAAPAAPLPAEAVYVTGDDTLLGLKHQYTSTSSGDMTLYRGGVVTLSSDMDDPRASGMIHFAFSVDSYPSQGAGVEWGTMLLENADGTWTGPCAGGGRNGGEPYAASCWLTGSGAYEGYTYYRQHIWGPGESPTVQGIIFTGVAPTDYPEAPIPGNP